MKRTDSLDLNARMFPTALRNVIDPDSPLVQVRDGAAWRAVEKEMGPLLNRNGAGGVSNRLMVGLSVLKALSGCSETEAISRWTEDPHWQYFCGERFLSHDEPIDRPGWKKWRKWMKKEGFSALLDDAVARVRLEEPAESRPQTPHVPSPSPAKAMTPAGGRERGSSASGRSGPGVQSNPDSPREEIGGRGEQGRNNSPSASASRPARLKSNHSFASPLSTGPAADRPLERGADPALDRAGAGAFPGAVADSHAQTSVPVVAGAGLPKSGRGVGNGKSALPPPLPDAVVFGEEGRGRRETTQRVPAEGTTPMSTPPQARPVISPAPEGSRQTPRRQESEGGAAATASIEAAKRDVAVSPIGKQTASARRETDNPIDRNAAAALPASPPRETHLAHPVATEVSPALAPAPVGEDLLIASAAPPAQRASPSPSPAQPASSLPPSAQPASSLPPLAQPVSPLPPPVAEEHLFAERENEDQSADSASPANPRAPLPPPVAKERLFPASDYETEDADSGSPSIPTAIRGAEEGNTSSPARESLRAQEAEPFENSRRDAATLSGSAATLNPARSEAIPNPAAVAAFEEEARSEAWNETGWEPVGADSNDLVGNGAPSEPRSNERNGRGSEGTLDLPEGATGSGPFPGGSKVNGDRKDEDTDSKTVLSPERMEPVFDLEVVGFGEMIADGREPEWDDDPDMVAGPRQDGATSAREGEQEEAEAKVEESGSNEAELDGNLAPDLTIGGEPNGIPPNGNRRSAPGSIVAPAAEALSAPEPERESESERESEREALLEAVAQLDATAGAGVAVGDSASAREGSGLAPSVAADGPETASRMEVSRLRRWVEGVAQDLREQMAVLANREMSFSERLARIEQIWGAHQEGHWGVGGMDLRSGGAGDGSAGGRSAPNGGDGFALSEAFMQNWNGWRLESAEPLGRQWSGLETNLAFINRNYRQQQAWDLVWGDETAPFRDGVDEGDVQEGDHWVAEALDSAPTGLGRLESREWIESVEEGLPETVDDATPGTLQGLRESIAARKGRSNPENTPATEGDLAERFGRNFPGIVEAWRALNGLKVSGLLRKLRGGGWSLDDETMRHAPALSSTELGAVRELRQPVRPQLALVSEGMSVPGGSLFPERGEHAPAEGANSPLPPFLEKAGMSLMFDFSVVDDELLAAGVGSPGRDNNGASTGGRSRALGNQAALSLYA